MTLWGLIQSTLDMFILRLQFTMATNKRQSLHFYWMQGVNDFGSLMSERDPELNLIITNIKTISIFHVFRKKKCKEGGWLTTLHLLPAFSNGRTKKIYLLCKEYAQFVKWGSELKIWREESMSSVTKM